MSDGPVDTIGYVEFQFAKFLAGLPLVIGLENLPYGYYTFLKLWVCVVCFCGILLFSTSTKRFLLLPILLSIALLYNPIFKVAVEKEIWQLINLLTAVFFFVLPFPSNHRVR